MSPALQVVLFLMCVAIALFVFMMIPLSILLYRRAIGFSRQLGELNTELKGLIQDSRTMFQNISSVTIHVNKQLDELDGIAGVIRKWSERADQVVEEVGSVVTVPVLRIAHTIKLLRNTWKLFTDAIFGDFQKKDHMDKECGEIKR